MTEENVSQNDTRIDQELLLIGDNRNVVDKYRNWKVEAIKADLDINRIELEIAIENWQHDFNIGSIVRTANAFNVKTVHIIGKRHWNRRGAMVTDRYMNIVHHPTTDDFIKAVAGKSIIGIDNLPGAVDMSGFTFPRNTVLVFGGEGPGLSSEMQRTIDHMVMIEQFGSTRSVNVGVAAGIAMYAWLQDNVLTPK